MIGNEFRKEGRDDGTYRKWFLAKFDTITEGVRDGDVEREENKDRIVKFCASCDDMADTNMRWPARKTSQIRFHPVSTVVMFKKRDINDGSGSIPFTIAING